MMMISIILGASSMIEGMTMEKEKGMQDIMEIVDPPRKQGSPGMKNQMLFPISKRSIILYWPSPLPLLQSRWEIGLLIVVPQGTSPDTRKRSLI